MITIDHCQVQITRRHIWVNGPDGTCKIRLSGLDLALFNLDGTEEIGQIDIAVKDSVSSSTSSLLSERQPDGRLGWMDEAWHKATEEELEAANAKYPETQLATFIRSLNWWTNGTEWATT